MLNKNKQNAFCLKIPIITYQQSKSELLKKKKKRGSEYYEELKNNVPKYSTCL